MTSSQKESDAAPKHKFIYDALNPSTAEIRLLDLRISEDNDVQCELVTTTLDQAPNYEALSYTWGSQDDKLAITVCNQSLEVTRNLYVALQHLKQKRSLPETARLRSHRRLWVDAICINQDDIDERNQQVRLMWSIYSKAARVLVWLGEERDESNLGMEMVRLLNLNFERYTRSILERISRDDESSGMENRIQGAQGAGEDETRGKVVNKSEEEIKENQEQKGRSAARATQKEAAEPVEIAKETQDNPETSGESGGQSHSSMTRERPPKNEPKELLRYVNTMLPFELLLCNEEEHGLVPLLLLARVYGAGSDGEDPCEWIAFQKLMERPWWSRMWVVQEVAAAKKSIWVGCGTSWLEWETFVGAAWTIKHHKDRLFLHRLAHLGAGTSWIWQKEKYRSRMDGRLDNWGGLLNLLADTHGCSSSDPRDRVFALLGFTPSIGLVPDYTMAIEDLYEAVVKRSVASTRCLMMLSLGRKPKKLQLPSWVPDLSSEFPDDVYNLSCPLGFYGADGNNWQNVGMPSPNCTLDPTDGKGQLTVCGFTYDTPLVLGSAWDGTPDDRQPKVFGLISEYENLLRDTDAAHFPHLTGQHREECFWRTLIWNATAQDHYPAPYEYGAFFKRIVEENHCLVDLHDISVDPQKNRQRFIPDGEPMKYYHAFVRNGFNRRFFITSKGHLGSGPPDMRSSDLVCVLMGAKTPVILRQARTEEGYEFVGTAYVHGIMHGEALGALSDEMRSDGRQMLAMKNFLLV
jgi:hypothetical protein